VTRAECIPACRIAVIKAEVRTAEYRCVIVSALLSICASSCGGGGLPLTAPTPALNSAPADHTLNWEGTTSDGLAVGFRISADHVTGIYIELPEVQADACAFGLGGFSIDGFDNFDLNSGRAGPPITNGGFSVTSSAPISNSPGASQASVAFVLNGHINGSSGEGSAEFVFSSGVSSAACTAVRRVTWSITEERP